jgi:hypothetical protein
MAQGWEGEERTRTFEANGATLEETSNCEKQAAQSVRGPSAMKLTFRFYPKSTFGFFFAIERSRSAALRGFRDPCSQLCTAL